MSNKQRIFSEIKTISDFKKELEEHPNYVYRSYFNKESLEYALTSLSIMSEEYENKFIEFIHHIDKTYSMAGASEGNGLHKYPVALAGAIYYGYYPETLSGLNYDEISILARHAIPKPIDFYPTSVEYFGKELIKSVHSVGEDFMYHSMYMNLAESKLHQGMLKDEVTSYIQNQPLEELKQEAFANIRESIQEVGKYI